ncbi:hypothetical protein EI94DRAFT_1885478 [Lactarius quietus]|nr:hypothetical protein EI94DRAFT_1885478 [Lactarius quietus]
MKELVKEALRELLRVTALRTNLLVAQNEARPLPKEGRVRILFNVRPTSCHNEWVLRWNSPFPIKRGLVRRLSGDGAEGARRRIVQGIVARGYDTTFNIGEVSWKILCDHNFNEHVHWYFATNTAVYSTLLWSPMCKGRGLVQFYLAQTSTCRATYRQFTST